MRSKLLINKTIFINFFVKQLNHLVKDSKIALKNYYDQFSEPPVKEDMLRACHMKKSFLGVNQHTIEGIKLKIGTILCN